MTTFIALLALVLYVVFYFTYGKTIRDKLLDSGKAPKAPSERLGDGVDSTGELSAAAIDRVLGTLDDYSKAIAERSCEAERA